MFSAPSIEMVDGQEFPLVLTTTLARAAIRLYRIEAQAQPDVIVV
jgi:hypothetical protein